MDLPLARVLFDIITDNDEALKVHMKEFQPYCFTKHFCRLAARVGSYRCFVYIFESEKYNFYTSFEHNVLITYLVKDIASSMSVEIYKYIQKKFGSYFSCFVPYLYRYALFINNESMMCVIKDLSPDYVVESPYVMDGFVETLHPAFAHIKEIVTMWCMDDDVYENGIQWMPLEMLEETAYQILFSMDEFNVAIALCFL